MAEPGSWIKLNRNILNWYWFSRSSVTVHVWLYLMCKANIKSNSSGAIAVNRGQHITTIKTIEDDLHLTRQNVRTALEHLKDSGEITTETISKKLLITICNYEKYQGRFTNTNRDKAKEDVRSTNDDTETDNAHDEEDPVAETYIPTSWERKIVPKKYWGQFQTEDDWYEYSGSHWEEISS